MKSIQALILLKCRDIKISLIIFWSILMSIFTTILVLLIVYPAGIVNQGGPTSVYIYCFVTGIVMLNETLPFSLGMNIRRKDYYKASMIVFFGLSLSMATIIMILSLIERWFSDQLSISLAFFSTPFFTTEGAFFKADTIISGWVTHFIIILFVLSLGYLLSAVNFRFGKVGMFTLSTSFVLFLLVMSIFRLWGSIGIQLFAVDSLWKMLLLLIGIATVFSGISYALLKRAVVRT